MESTKTENQKHNMRNTKKNHQQPAQELDAPDMNQDFEIIGEIVRFDMCQPGVEMLVKIDGEVQVVKFDGWETDQEELGFNLIMMDELVRRDYQPGVLVEVRRECGEYQLCGLAWILCDCGNCITAGRAAEPSVTCDSCGKVWRRKLQP